MVGYVILASNLYLVAVVDDELFFFFFFSMGVGYQILYWNNAINPTLTSHLLRDASNLAS